MKNFLMIVIVYVLSSLYVAVSAEMTGRLYWGDDVKKVTLIPGDIVNTTLHIFNPSAEAKAFNYSSMAGQSFADHFYVVEAKDARQNENNADVWQVSLTLIVKNFFDTNLPLIASYGSINYPLSLSVATVENIQEQNEQILILDQAFTPLYPRWPILLALLAAFLLVFFGWRIGKKIWNKKQYQKAKQQMVSQFREKLLSAKVRRDFEELYASRELWQEYFPNFEMSRFAQLMELHQYRAIWDEPIEEQLKGIIEKGVTS